MDKLLDKIENDYSNFCNMEYVFRLDDNTKVNLVFKKQYLPHLIGLHKLDKHYTQIRQMVDKNDFNITPKNIFETFRSNNISYNTLKNGMGWTIHLQNRMENFTYNNIDLILRKATMFSFIYEEGKTKNDKAKYVLVDKTPELFLHLYIGYNHRTDCYFPNSFVPNVEKDTNLGRKTLKIIKTEIYRISSSGKRKIESIEHKKIREISNILKSNLKLYNIENTSMYKVIYDNSLCLEKLKHINELVYDIKSDYINLMNYTTIDCFVADKSNAKLICFLENAGVLVKPATNRE